MVKALEGYMSKCHYCDNNSTKTLIWLKDRKQRPARIELPWCGCDLQVALKRFWSRPYMVVEGIDYEIKHEEKMQFNLTQSQTDKFVAWRDKQSTKGRYPDGPRFAFVFVPSNIGMKVKVIDQATKDELDLTECN